MPTRYPMTVCVVFCALAAVLSAVLPARAANEIQPGLWQDTDTGTANDKPMPPRVSTNCITPEEAKNIARQAQAEMQKTLKEQAQHCSEMNVRESGNTITFEMKCGDPKQATFEASSVITFLSPQHTTSITKTEMTLMGHTLASTVTTDSKWIAATCKK